MSTRESTSRRRSAAATVVVIVILVLVAALTFWLNSSDDQPSPTADVATASSVATSIATESSTPSPRSKARTTSTRATPTPRPAITPRTAQVPAHVLRTLGLIDAGDWPEAANSPGTRGGMTFRNNERRLPATDGSGRRATYREWDVNPKRPGRSRDAERIITGADGSAWYTDDHYDSFVLIRGPSR